ncbi:MAG: MBL fold metallo-hydrolase [Candidatus Micrarchaeota archaeon]
MELIFLGTGGGRVNLLKQIRSTGGQWLRTNDLNIMIDPGPGSILQCKKYSLDPLKLDAIIVTHYHIDHCNESSLMVEGMTSYALKKKGIFIGSRYVVEGDAKGDTGITRYHLGKIGTVYTAKYGERKKFKTKNSEFEIEIIKSRHDEPTGFGFKLSAEGKTMGIISDTEYFEELGELYKGCDTLFVSCLKPKKDQIPDHLKTDDVIAIARKAMPKKIIIYHLGMKMLSAGPEKEAKKIEDATGIKCMAAKDGMKVDII